MFENVLQKHTKSLLSSYINSLPSYLLCKIIIILLSLFPFFLPTLPPPSFLHPPSLPVLPSPIPFPSSSLELVCCMIHRYVSTHKKLTVGGFLKAFIALSPSFSQSRRAFSPPPLLPPMKVTSFSA